MKSANKPEKKRIVFVGKSGVGKSSLINAFSGEELCAVRSNPDDSSFHLKKSVEIYTSGPLILIDTPGIGEAAESGPMTITKTIKAITNADFAVVVIDARDRLQPQELELFRRLQKISMQFVIVINKIEFGVNPLLLSEIKWLHAIHFEVSCAEKVGIDNLKRKLLRMLPEDSTPPIISDLVSQGDVVVLVAPSDLGTPKSRTIIPQIQTIKEALDGDTIVIVSNDKQIRSVLYALKNPPDLVVAENNVIMRIAIDMPESVKLTTFSILTARYKGDLPKFLKGLKTIDSLQDGDKILITEVCHNHHNRGDNGSRITLPDWLKHHTKKDIQIKIHKGCDFPEEISDYKLIIHCEGCVLSRRAMQARIKQTTVLDIPMTSYGVLNSFIHGAIPRALEPFGEAVN